MGNFPHDAPTIRHEMENIMYIKSQGSQGLAVKEISCGSKLPFHFATITGSLLGVVGAPDLYL